MSQRKKLKLNIKYNKGIVECAKSPQECIFCREKNKCETINTYYYPYEGMKECFNNNERRR
jgi:hypothetical protein